MMKRCVMSSREILADRGIAAVRRRAGTRRQEIVRDLQRLAHSLYKAHMARAIWSGAISFGLVNVPVKLFSATSPKSVRFHQLSSKTGARIRQKRVDPTTGEEVPFEDIVKGYEITPEHYVLISNEELEALDPKATRTIDIEEFVDLAEIDPIYYDHSYYLAPAAGGAKAYRLLVDAMRESEKVAIGRLVHADQAATVRAAAQRRGADAEHDAVRRRGASSPTASTSSMASRRPRPASAS